MAMNFKKTAQEVGALEQDLLAGRAQAKLESIYDETVTVRAFGIRHWEQNGEEGDYPVVTFDEYPKAFFRWSGVMLERALFAWANECGCHAADSEELPFSDFDALNEELSKQNLKMRFGETKTSKGNRLKVFEIIDE